MSKSATRSVFSATQAAALAAMLWLGCATAHAQDVVRIQNVFRAGQQINIEKGAVETSVAQPGWASAQWTIEPVAGSANVRIKNIWKATYLNVETGALQTTAIKPDWLSAQWVLEAAPNNAYRIKNVWKNTYLHTESGTLAIGAIQPGWQSALWTLPGYRPAAAAAPAAAPAASLAAHNDQNQCVKNMAPIAARVKWFNPTDFVKEPSGEFKLIKGRTPVLNETIAVLQRSCIQKNVRMTAVVSVEGGEYLNTSIQVAVGTVLAAGGAAVCVGTAGAGCGPALTGAVVGITTLAAGSASFLPDAKDVVYMGSPGLLEVRGTAWDAKGVETRAWDAGKAVGAACEENKDCINNQCGRATAAENAAKVCCRAGSQALPYAGYDYCNQMPKGSTCWSDAQCASGSCKGNMNGMQRGTCQ